MEGKEEKMRDEIVPIKECNSDIIKTVWHSDGIKKYCPQFGHSHFIYGDYYSEKFSWYRLVVHACDEKEREAKGKKCKS